MNRLHYLYAADDIMVSQLLAASAYNEWSSAW